jgi:phenylacetate-CoA ligase
MATSIRSSIHDIVWPAVVTGEGSGLLAMAFQLEQTQWWSAQDLQAHQYRQLAALLRHARATVPWYEERFEGAGLTGGEPPTPESWLRIPLLTREDIRLRLSDLACGRAPPGHGNIRQNRTSGSTGEPLEVITTQVSGLVWESLAFRSNLWHERDFSGRFVAIRSGRYARDPLAVYDLPTWGPIAPPIHEAGPMTIFHHTMPVPRQAEILESQSPHYLLTYPSNARALCRYARQRPLRLPDLRAVHTYGEPLTPDVRAACRETWGVPVQDVYSCEEAGFLAVQCPRHEHHHVQSESVLVEILDEQGRPSLPGQVGAVVLTPLHNFAMPLIRYSIGDYAEAGEACPCGRGLPVLKRVLGRGRGRVALPDGRRAWPDIGAIWAAIQDVEAIQLVQRDQDRVEVRFAREEPLSPSEEEASCQRIHRALGHPFHLTFTREDTIARQPNGKYETFFDAR